VSVSGFRVLVLDPGNFTPYYDANLCQALANQGVPVEWITSLYLFEPIPDPQGVCVRHAFFTLFDKSHLFAWALKVPWLRRVLKGISYPVEMLRLTRELRGRTPAVIHVQWSLMPGLDGLLIRLWRRWGWRIVYTAHDLLPLGPSRRRLRLESWDRLERRWLYRAADALIVHSEANRRTAVGLGAPAERIHVLPLGGQGHFQEASLTREDARIRLGLDPHKPLALFFGLIKPYKGLGVLLRSMPSVRTRVPQAHLMVAGVPMEPLATTLRLITELNLEEQVTLHARYIPSDSLATYFSAADVVVLPYLEVSLSAVLVTAYEYARPVIVTAVGGLPEMVEEGKTGLIVPAGDVQALASALVALLEDPSRCREMGAQARRLAEARHSWPAIARQTAEVYEQVWRERTPEDPLPGGGDLPRLP
jgi:glycosyltransferase involved in cell wall biosynthesis